MAGYEVKQGLEELPSDVINALAKAGKGNVGEIIKQYEAAKGFVPPHPAVQGRDASELFALSYLVKRIEKEGKRIGTDSNNDSRCHMLYNHSIGIRLEYSSLNYERIISRADRALKYCKKINAESGIAGGAVKLVRRWYWDLIDEEWGAYRQAKINDLPALLTTIKHVAQRLSENTASDL
jgi:hypothetical protein